LYLSLIAQIFGGGEALAHLEARHEETVLLVVDGRVTSVSVDISSGQVIADPSALSMWRSGKPGKCTNV